MSNPARRGGRGGTGPRFGSPRLIMKAYGSARCKPGSADEDAEAAPRPLAAWPRGEAGLTEEVSPRAKRRMPPASHWPPSDQCRNAVHGATTSVRRTSQTENPSHARLLDHGRDVPSAAMTHRREQMPEETHAHADPTPSDLRQLPPGRTRTPAGSRTLYGRFVVRPRRTGLRGVGVGWWLWLG